MRESLSQFKDAATFCGGVSLELGNRIVALPQTNTKLDKGSCVGHCPFESGPMWGSMVVWGAGKECG